MRSKVLLLAVVVALVLSLAVGTVSASASGYGCRKHYVQWGETLYSIGRHYNVNPYSIASANYIRHPDYIRGGTWLCVPYGPPYPGYDRGYSFDTGYGHYDKSYGRYDTGYYGPYDTGYYGRYDKGHGYYDEGYGRYDKGYSYGRYDKGYSYGYGH
jgi:hypothetical protein